MKAIFFLFSFLCYGITNAQGVDSDLLMIKKRMDSIEEFTSHLTLDLDISFINMPTKTADMHYRKNKPIKFSSDDFVLIPKRGLDFTMNELLKYSFITVDRGLDEKDGSFYKVINVIPTDNRADFAIATLILDTLNQRIVESEINTKKDGSYTLNMRYANADIILPEMVIVSFEIDRIKIPLNYMGKETEIDKKELKSDGPKSGKIILQISDYEIVYREE